MPPASTPVPSTLSLPACPGAWQTNAAQLALALRGPVRARLDELGVISVEGADAVSFLQGQLTNDTAGLAPERVQLTGYCTAKGRLLAVFEQWRDGATILLQLPVDLVATVSKRLSMFVLRAKVQLADASSQWRTMGLVGPGSAALIEHAWGVSPEQGASCTAGAARISRLGDGTRSTERFMIRYRTEDAPAVEAALAAATEVDSGVWWWSEVDAARPRVFAATQDAFVPQMINLEVLGGVNFRKGCYPGQEVVARSQYLGKLRRRMSLGHIDGRSDDAPDASICAGSDVFIAGENEPAGRVVMAAQAPGGGIDVLFECPVDRLDVSALRIGGVVPTLRPLPYALVDVTA
jgi:folate-binding protein YgfZ